MINNKYINVFKNNPYTIQKNNDKVIVFDLDETLGSFTDLEIIWNTILLFNNKQLNTEHGFYYLLDLFHEFTRYGIVNILDYVYQKKLSKECFKIFLYTNNQSSKRWVNMICNYFSFKLNIIKPNILFDQIIYAFKINNKVVEHLRTSHKKKHSDFIKCTLMPNNTEICFIDNTYFNDMNNKRVYYIQPLSYQHNLHIKDIVSRLFNSDFNKYIPNTDTNRLIFYNNLSSNRYDYNEGSFNKLLDTNIIVSQKIMYYIKDFFLITNKKNKTKKNIYSLNKYTRRKK
jgi:hypothetical protein